jgi:DNA-binding SARP family transcriptional activator
VPIAAQLQAQEEESDSLCAATDDEGSQGDMLDALRMTVERLSTELEVSKAREADILQKAQDSAKELASMRSHVCSLNESLTRQTTEVRISSSLCTF